MSITEFKRILKEIEALLVGKELSEEVLLAVRMLPEFLREVYFSPSQEKFYRGPLPPGYDEGDFAPDPACVDPVAEV